MKLVVSVASASNDTLVGAVGDTDSVSITVDDGDIVEFHIAGIVNGESPIQAFPKISHAVAIGIVESWGIFQQAQWQVRAESQ